MSEEEKQAIELLKIDCLITLQQINDGELFMIEDEEKRRISATQVLLNLIDKQQKEIEYLKSQIPQDKIFYYSEKDYISKDKIKEKIKEIETLSMLDFVEKEKFDFKYSLDGIYCMQKGVVFILKELLGE